MTETITELVQKAKQKLSLIVKESREISSPLEKVSFENHNTQFILGACQLLMSRS